MFGTSSKRRRAIAGAVLAASALVSCGGGGAGGGSAESASCSVADQQAWLSDYMGRWYFWYRLGPRPDVSAFGEVAAFFRALLYTGNDTSFPRDRWSGSESTETFNRFFGDGASLGYGVSVAGLEVTNQPTRALWVRGVEPGSPAALAGVQRGDQVLSLNARPTSEVILADDFSDLSATQAGQLLTLVLMRDGVTRHVSLTAAIYSLVPVSGETVFTSAAGRRVAYLAVKNMITQAQTPTAAAFARFKAAGVDDLVLDLRYNGGGLVTFGGELASYIAGDRGAGRTYASLLYNDQQSSSNRRYLFDRPAAALSLPRVFVLTGRRTCSASEQVISGLRGAGLQVVAVGETTCGKPVGFLPVAQCGTTYSVVNFESVNDRNEGRYWDGLMASCAVAENFQVPQGDPAADPLLSTALLLADGQACPALAEDRRQPLSVQKGIGRPDWLLNDRRAAELR